MTKPETDYKDISSAILRLEKLNGEQSPSKATITHYQTLLDDASSNYKYDRSVAYLYSAFYELQSLIYLIQGDAASALKFMNESADVKPPKQNFISITAQTWYKERTERSLLTSKNRYHKTVGKKRLSKRTKIILVSIVGVIVVIGVISGPISDYYTLKNANPTMLKLASDASMTRQGELIFLRTNPQLVNDTQLAQACPAAQTNDDGFIEQGCYVPNKSDPTTGNIYIRKMASDLYSLEVTTAAYEMLHPAYISIAEQGDNGAALNKSIEANLAHLAGSDLTAQVANFAKTEPGARDLELFSILGTGYNGISSDLASYYAPYITDLKTDISLNDKVTGLFQNDQSQLITLQDLIKSTDVKATTAYNYSLSWARAGNQYENTYNYNIYVQDLTTENNYIDQYNTLLDQYKILVSEFNGQQFDPQSQVQSQ